MKKDAQIEAISEAIADGTLGMSEAVQFTIALADGSWKVVKELFKLLEGLV